MNKVVGSGENHDGGRFMGDHILFEPPVDVWGDVTVLTFVDDFMAGGLPPQTCEALAAPVRKAVYDAVSDADNFHADNPFP